MSGELIKSADWLEDLPTVSEGPSELQADERISELIRAWLAFDPPARLAEAHTLTQGQRSSLYGYAERMATLAVRRFDEQFVELGLAALMLDGGRSDFRDTLVVMGALHDAAIRVEGSPDRLFRWAAGLVPTNPFVNPLDFINRRPLDKSLTSMGYSASADADGFRYIWTGAS